MKAEKQTAPAKGKASKNIRFFELNLEEGASILQTPTGEEWRIAAVDSEKISFEKID